MSRRKGKSTQRIKGWDQRLAAGEEVTRHAARERFLPPAVKLPPRELLVGQENLDDLPRADGMVMGHFPGGAMVLVGGQVLRCGIARTFRAPEGTSPLTVGDTVTVALAQHSSQQVEADKLRSDGVILARGPRRTVLARPQPRSGKHRDEYGTQETVKVVVANMDVLLIVAATRQPPLRHGLIDRFLIVAERGDLAPVVVLNKIDLGPADAQVLDDFAGWTLPIVQCSAVTGQGLAELRAELAGKRSVLAGASGVGKSTLVNALVPGAAAAVAEVRPADERGRHTTSSVTIYELDPQTFIVDTPGVRELGLNLDAAQLSWYFPEFEQRAPQCKFNDCLHVQEPGCAVLAAVEKGEIPLRRYQSYLRLLETLEHR